jgi:hypothetical protein
MSRLRNFAPAKTLMSIHAQGTDTSGVRPKQRVLAPKIAKAKV